MPLNLANTNGSVTVNGSAATSGQSLNDGDLVETGAGGSVNIVTSGQLVAYVGNSNALSTYSPPTSQVSHFYYNNSYRYRLQILDGSNVGIRG